MKDQHKTDPLKCTTGQLDLKFGECESLTGQTLGTILLQVFKFYSFLSSLKVILLWTSQEHDITATFSQYSNLLPTVSRYFILLYFVSRPSSWQLKKIIEGWEKQIRRIIVGKFSFCGQSFITLSNKPCLVILHVSNTNQGSYCCKSRDSRLRCVC